MTENLQIEKILHVVKSKIEAHNEFKKAYNEQLALDFNIFNFFNIGENKVSEILAYFLNPCESHGQSDKFLKEFLQMFFEDELDTSIIHIECEKAITDNRRIDVFIKIGNKYIAIENKIWANDQVNQLRDYSQYLNVISDGNYLLLYLNPYGTNPTVGSIEKEQMTELALNKRFKTISYKNEIFTLIDRWLSVCSADNVTFFIKQFKLHLTTKFLGIKTLNMTNNIKELIFANQTEVEMILAAYNEIQQKIAQKLDSIAIHLQTEQVVTSANIKITKVPTFMWEGARVYKWSLESGKNKLFVQLVKDKVTLSIGHYFQGSSDIAFKQLAQQTHLRHIIFEQNSTNDHIIELFTDQINAALQIFKLYDATTNTVEVGL